MHSVVTIVEAVGSFLVGLLVTRALFLANGWWLNSGGEVVRTSLVLAALGLFAALWRFGRPWIRVSGLWTGVMVEMTVLLFLAGPGTIWPIVLVFAAAISAVAVFGGAWAGSMLTGRGN